MPSLFRTRTPSPTYQVRLQEASPLKKSVGFAPGPTPVTSFSRLLTEDEQWKLYYYEAHAYACATCSDAYQVHRRGGRLCPTGHELAQTVASFVRSKADGDIVLDATSHSTNPVHLSLPQGYYQCRSLLRAMERSLRHKRQRPIVTVDSPRSQRSRPKTSTARPSTPERRVSLRDSLSHSPPVHAWSSRDTDPSPQRYLRREPHIVDWPDVEYQIREPSQIIQPSTLRRTRTSSESKPKSKSSKSSSSPSRRASYHAATVLPDTLQLPSRHRSTTVPVPATSAALKQAHRHSLYDDYSSYANYGVEIREPKTQPKRHSTVMF